MKKLSLGGLLVGTLALLTSSIPSRTVAQAQGQVLVIQGGTLIDGNGGQPLANSVVVIQGNQITAVGRAGQVQTPAGAQIVNANGKWILPGLWDCYENYSWFYGELMLNQGVTSGCDVGNGDELSIAHKAAVEHGKIRGPRTWIGIAHLGGVQPDELTGWETPLQRRQMPKTLEETRTVVTRLLDAGADMIMFQDAINFTPEMVKAACDLAHARNKPCTQRAGDKMPPSIAAMAGVDILPQASGIAAEIQKVGTNVGNNDEDRYSEMDDAKAKALIDILVKEDVHPVSTIINRFATYPKNWTQMQAPIFEAFTNPNLRAYYPADFFTEQQQTRTRYRTGAARERQQRGYLNMLRFTKMLIDAGGKPLIGGATNADKVPGFVIHDEMEIWQEGGIKQMQIIQAATKWTADAMKIGNKIGSIEPGRIADLVVVDADPLADIANLRKIDNVVFDGKVIDRGFHAWYSTPFLGSGGSVRAVEDLPWVRRLKAEYPGGRGGANAANFPDPAESPPPAIQTMVPVMVTQGDPTTTVRLTGFNFVARSRVLFDGRSVPWRRVSATEMDVTLDENLLHSAGRFDIVVVNPDPQAVPKWSDGTSNKAHLLVNYRY